MYGPWTIIPRLNKTHVRRASSHALHWRLSRSGRRGSCNYLSLSASAAGSRDLCPDLGSIVVCESRSSGPSADCTQLQFAEVSIRVRMGGWETLHALGSHVMEIQQLRHALSALPSYTTITTARAAVAAMTPSVSMNRLTMINLAVRDVSKLMMIMGTSSDAPAVVPTNMRPSTTSLCQRLPLIH
ncbi:hypothetical protein AC579_4811 [Pseudocercospora musae]|uniref:Uncharacterized protein n=1 Tax=Pseudocercospora musae TaxID=113226 RepID=A0A139IIL6_9PEZI|nr:hypothetical protein AC579_4811 [Pseudocercospora musae]